MSEFVVDAYYNRGNFTFHRNGESFVLETISKWASGRKVIVWDVGAHHGEWAETTNALIPQSSIVSFEIIPKIFDLIPKRSWLTAINSGLSDHDGEVEVSWAKGFDTANAIEPRDGHLFFEQQEKLLCGIAKGDTIIAGGVPAPEILKIDTEGHEVPVLRGLSDCLAKASPELIQLEYGETYLPGGYTLKNVYDILSPHGYHIGRLYPDHVDFAPYTYRSDDFRLGNMIAVRNPELLKMLS